jgi:hypothetical protein
MDAKDETLSLRDNPLPPEPITSMPGDEHLPSRILQADGHIGSLERALSLAREARDVLMQRAVSLGIGEDEHAVILRREKNLPREINPGLFQSMRPVQYQMARDIEIAVAMEKIQKQIDSLETAGTTIRIKTVETLMPKGEIDQICFPHKIVTTYEVQSIKLPLPKGAVRKLLEQP